MVNLPETVKRQTMIDAVDEVIRERKTAKVLRDPADCPPGTAEDWLPPDFVEQVRQAVAVAGWAPFHKAVHRETHLTGALASPVPWRFYILERASCCALVAHIRARAAAQPESKWSKAWGSKIPRLLAATGALVLITWLPDPPAEGQAPALTDNNMEHIAAAAAATQNLLLAAEARGLHTYWSSGGILGDAEAFALVGIPAPQKLLSAIFLAPPGAPHDAIEPGALRDKRGDPAQWSAWPTVLPPEA
jgi:nitroreductase